MNSKHLAVWLWSTGALVCAVVVGVFFLWLDATAPMEVLAPELIRRDGLLYHAEQTEPFTGILVEKFPNGGLKSRSEIRAGVLHGVSQGWHSNGQLEVREFFKQAVSHGLREKWYDTGVKMSEASIVEGQHEGVFRRWHENGVLAEEVTMRQSQPDGLSRAFYPSGYLKMQVTISNGEVVDTKSWADGELKESPTLAHFK